MKIYSAICAACSAMHVLASVLERAIPEPAPATVVVPFFLFLPGGFSLLKIALLVGLPSPAQDP
jgi:hypothetical protein